MAKNILKFRTVKHGNPDKKFKMLPDALKGWKSKRSGISFLGTLTLCIGIGFAAPTIVPAAYSSLNVPAALNPNCKIKGNISLNSGERIYHVPGQKHYAPTVISPSYGERWFCSEKEARDAGWRKSRS